MTQTSNPSTHAAAPDESASSAILHAGALLLESRRLLVALALFGSLTAIVTITIIGPRYSATASFMPQAGGDSDLSALMGIAGQFGVPLRGASSTPSPELYAALVTSPVVLDPIARESFATDTSPGSSRQSLAELFDETHRDPRREHEKVIEELQENVAASVNRRTGVIGLRVRTRWPAVSQRIAERILEELNSFNLQKRQSQAKAERVFAEGRAAEARADLTIAENAARDFAMRNRVVSVSPTLRLEADRLDREVDHRQQMWSAAVQSLESARLREVQDTPVITVFQEPMVLSIPDARGRVKWMILGAILGLLAAAFVIPLRAFVGGSRDLRTAEAARFRAAVEATKRQVLGPFTRRGNG